MIRFVLLTVTGLAMAGCSAETQLSNPFGKGESAHTKLAAFAATSKYPTSQPANDLRAVAMINRSNGSVRVINTTDQALRDVRVWVDGNYVTRVDTIPSKGFVTLNRNDFFDSNGISLSTVKTPVNKVQVETPDKFYNLQGPVFE